MRSSNSTAQKGLFLPLLLCTLFLSCGLFSSTEASTGDMVLRPVSALPEYRFMWVTRYQVQTTRDVELVVERAKKYNFNALFVQVCALGEAFYHSDTLPWGKGVSTEFDPLRELTRRAHAEGIEVHAWINTLFIWEVGRKLPENPRHVLNAHPEWLVRDKNGKNVFDYPSWEWVLRARQGLFLDPALPEVQRYITSIFLEVAEQYPVDGLHFDYIRYPGPEFGYSAQASMAFQQEHQADPIALVSNKNVAMSVYGEERYQELMNAWKLFRTEQVEAIVRNVRQGLRARNKELKLSAAVAGDLERGKRDYFQDWERWARNGLVDMIVPMCYAVKTDTVEEQVSAAVRITRETRTELIVGLGAWRQSPEEIAEKIYAVRTMRDQHGELSVQGISLFSYDSMAAKNEYLSTLRDLAFQGKVDTPLWPWKKESLLAPSTNIVLQD